MHDNEINKNKNVTYKGTICVTKKYDQLKVFPVQYIL